VFKILFLKTILNFKLFLKTNDYNLLTSMTKTFRVAVLKCCRAGCSTTTWDDLLAKNHQFSEI
jgi:hypothetical protein